MLKRAPITIALTLAMVLALPTWSAHTTGMTEAEMAALNAASASVVRDDEVKSGGGNRFVRILKAPFKAIGRLFGRGGDKKFHRLSEKDVEKFESAKVTRIVDARTVPTAPTQPLAGLQTDPDPTSGGPANPGDPNLALSLELLARGRQLLNANDPNAAIMDLSTAVSLNPRLRDAHNLLGIAYEVKGMRRQALLSLEFALKGDNDEPEHLNNYGYLLWKNGEYGKALKYLKRAVKLVPDEQRFLNNLALVQSQLGKFDDAYETFARAVGPFEGHMNIATRLQRLGREKHAIEHLESARALQPNNTNVLARLVTLYGRTGEPVKAAEASKALVAIQANASSIEQ